jgi:hypothetical protein
VGWRELPSGSAAGGLLAFVAERAQAERVYAKLGADAAPVGSAQPGHRGRAEASHGGALVTESSLGRWEPLSADDRKSASELARRQILESSGWSVRHSPAVRRIVEEEFVPDLPLPPATRAMINRVRAGMPGVVISARMAAAALWRSSWWSTSSRPERSRTSQSWHQRRATFCGSRHAERFGAGPTSPSSVGGMRAEERRGAGGRMVALDSTSQGNRADGGEGLGDGGEREPGEP